MVSGLRFRLNVNFLSGDREGRERRCSAPGGACEAGNGEGGSRSPTGCSGNGCLGCSEASDAANSDDYDLDDDDDWDSAFLAKEEEEFSQVQSIAIKLVSDPYMFSLLFLV